MFNLFKIGHHIRDKILFILFLIGVVPLLVSGVVSLVSINYLHKFDVASIENNLINQKAEEVNGFMKEITETFDLKVGFEQVSDIELSQQTFLLWQLLNEFPALEEASFINLEGEETSKLNRFYPSGVPADELQDQSKIEKFVKAKSGTKYISPAYFTSKGPIVTVSSPVLNKNGVIISVLTGEVNLSELQKITEKSRLGSEGYVYLIDRDGFMIANSQSDKITSESMRTFKFVDSVIKNAQEGSVNRYVSLWDESVIAEGKYLSDLGIAIIAEWPVKDADRVVITVRDQVLLFSLIVIGATLAVSILFAGQITKPIKTLREGTQMIAEGKFDQPVNIRTGDELEELGASFNKMTKGLKHLEELKNEFIFIAAHELKTPVAVIKGYLALILDGQAGPVSDQIKDINNKISNANQRLVQLVNDLLQIGRAEAGRLEIKVGPLDIIEPINTAIKEMSSLAGEKKIEIIYRSSDSLPKVIADRNRLQEVMTNLVSNAVKYNSEGGRIEVSHRVDGNNIITSVTDNGIGISEEAQKRLFEKFYRVQNEKTENISGTGLGLFIVKQIIEKMNGKIWVESEFGKGATFSFSLPLSG